MISNSWSLVKEVLDSMPEPTTEVVKEAKKVEGGAHALGKNSHSLIQYEYDFEIRGFPAQFIWSVCPECRIVWRKYLVVFNNQTNSAYQRVITHKGKPVDA